MTSLVAHTFLALMLPAAKAQAVTVCDSANPTTAAGSTPGCAVKRFPTGNFAYPTLQWETLGVLDTSTAQTTKMSLRGNRTMADNNIAALVLGLPAEQVAQMVTLFPSNVPFVFARYNPASANLFVEIFKIERVGSQNKMLRAAFAPGHGGAWAANLTYASASDKQLSLNPGINPSTATAHKVRGVKRDTDAPLGWVKREYPQPETWRALAVEWLKGETRGVGKRLKALVAFFERYLVQQGLPLDPAVFLARSTVLPDFYRTACPDSREGIEYTNAINAFLYFVLLREFSETTENGLPVVSPAFRNPVTRMSKGGLPKRDESVHSPLPYGYIDELRQMLGSRPTLLRLAVGSERSGYGNRPGRAQCT